MKIDNAGFQIHCHQIGDGAAQYGLDVLEKLWIKNGPRDRRPSFAHCQWIREADKKRMADLGVISIFSDYWMAADDYYWDLYLPFVGRKRADTMYPLKSLFDHGVNIAVHSDFYVSKPDPLYAIYSGMTRNISKREFNERYSESKKYRRSIDPKENYTYGEVGPLSPLKERASLDSMLYASTMGGARSLFLENEI
ncbi:MAG: hypothetical protein DRP59_13005 [Spirochaetes bacterium]|nr:MAG: hypothetical protein DRP59_13005 [Spirochaetota bacterium]